MKSVSFDRNKKRSGQPNTRFYSPTERKRRLKAERSGDAGPRLTVEETPVVLGQKKKDQRLGERVAVMAGLFGVSAMLLFILSGYAGISSAYGDINDLNSEIDDLRIRINALEAQLECAVTIEDAKAYAAAHGMVYPEQGQYVRVGDPIPATGTPSGIAGEAPPDNTGIAGQAPDDGSNGEGDAETPVTEG